MELMMTLAVVGVILGIAIPNFRDFLLNSRMTGTANDLHAGFQLARSEAIKRQRSVAICPSANPRATPPTCVSSTTWSNAASPAGWVVWVDANNDATPDAAEFVVAPHDPVAPSLSIASNFNVISYLSNGFAEVPGNPDERAILICDERGNQPVGDNYRKRVISVSRTGRAAVLRVVGEVDDAEDGAFGDTGNCPET